MKAGPVPAAPEPVTPRIVLCVGSLVPEHGGPSRSLTALASGLAGTSLDTHLLSVDAGPQYVAPLRPDDPRVQLHLAKPASGLRRRLRWSADFAARLGALVAPHPASIVHDNGLWLPNNAQAARLARAHSRPLVISPRGMLAHWALAQGRLRKRLAWWAFQHAALRSAALLHATADAEAAEFRALGLRAPIAIVPNGVDLPPPAAAPQPRSGRLRTALFLSRVHPKKGLPLLLTAWARLKPADWQLRIVGPDDGGHTAQMQALAAQLGIAATVRFEGPVGGPARWATYRAADLFVLPSHNENFGLVIAEAMACGLPVLTTTGTPWPALHTQQAGWWVAAEPAAWTAALNAALSTPEPVRQAMGARGAAYVRAHFEWSAVAQRLLPAYLWLLGRGPRPDCVQLD